MSQILSLLDIEFSSTRTPSACVTCQIRPKLVLNPDFIDKYCETDEHLFMLIMHELYHIILGHTALFKRCTEIDNIALDAIINAMLCQLYPEEEYTSFFTSLNKDSSFPSCLLRPEGPTTPNDARPLLKLLYEGKEGTYYDVYEILIRHLKTDLSSYILIGNHQDDGDINPIFKGMFEKILSKWPTTSRPIIDREQEGKNKEEQTELEKKTINERRKFEHFLTYIGIIKNGSTHYCLCQTVEEHTTGDGFIFNSRDRTLAVKRLLLPKSIMYKNEYTNLFQRDNQKTKVFIYLDVSGSVEDELKKIIPLLIMPLAKKECEVYSFSTTVEKVNIKQLHEGKYETTGDTEIKAVIDHLRSLPDRKRPRRILLLTDGFVDPIKTEDEEFIKENRIKVYCALFGKETIKKMLDPIVYKYKEIN